MLCFAAQMAIATAGFWHHHDHGQGQHNECAVCVAVTLDKSDGLPTPTVAPLPLQPLGLIILSQPRDPSISVPLRCSARAPPRV